MFFFQSIDSISENTLSYDYAPRGDASLFSTALLCCVVTACAHERRNAYLSAPRTGSSRWRQLPREWRAAPSTSAGTSHWMSPLVWAKWNWYIFLETLHQYCCWCLCLHCLCLTWWMEGKLERGGLCLDWRTSAMAKGIYNLLWSKQSPTRGTHKVQKEGKQCESPYIIIYKVAYRYGNVLGTPDLSDVVELTLLALTLLAVTLAHTDVERWDEMRPKFILGPRFILVLLLINKQWVRPAWNSTCHLCVLPHRLTGNVFIHQYLSLWW